MACAKPLVKMAGFVPAYGSRTPRSLLHMATPRCFQYVIRGGELQIVAVSNSLKHLLILCLSEDSAEPLQLLDTDVEFVGRFLPGAKPTAPDDWSGASSPPSPCRSAVPRARSTRSCQCSSAPQRAHGASQRKRLVQF